MRVLITGATGQVGHALIGSVPKHFEIATPTRGELDLGNALAVGTAVRSFAPHLIINCAAYTAVDRAESERDVAHRVNAEGPRHLAAAARALGARMIQISTDFVFDGRSSAPYLPQATPNPLSVYGSSKLEGERAALELLGPRAAVLRTAWVYSAGGSNFVLTMLRLMKANGSVRVVSDQVGTPTSADSVALAVWALAARPELHGVYHWTDAGVASWYDFAVAIAEEAAALRLLPASVMVHAISTAEYPTAAERPRFSVLDERSSTSALALGPTHWRVNLRKVLREIAGA